MIKIKKILVLTDISEYARHAREECIDLIVLTTQGRPGPSHALIVGTADQGVQMAPCPVLTIKNPEHEFAMPQACDLSKENNRLSARQPGS